MAELSYRQLFAFLEDLGFEELSTERDAGFYHEGSQTMFAFSGVVYDQPVREADLTAVQRQLQTHGLIRGDLTDKLIAAAVTAAEPSPSFLSRPWSRV